MATTNTKLESGKELSGKVALVTGGARNIGAAISLALAQGGASVAINTRASREDGERVVQEIRAAGGQAELYLADVADADAVKRMTDAVLQRFGRIVEVAASLPFHDQRGAAVAVCRAAAGAVRQRQAAVRHLHLRVRLAAQLAHGLDDLGHAAAVGRVVVAQPAAIGVEGQLADARDQVAVGDERRPRPSRRSRGPPAASAR
jgi:NAD(P)-dependent dehydrogenase (short-subunit alcohol dehydrogenase family)